jgi:hypothetical protein
VPVDERGRLAALQCGADRILAKMHDGEVDIDAGLPAVAG